ncbi:acetate/propionate family kinase [Aquabacterium sp. CECT 9606]|uniref:acetate/propionate family kinase n=1 Tax=Aquabacterium sp. CECT 9606 TaxID=2845822 RepID=UPI001E58B584|nr:acetate/propionate family kinase [Aquabacterium sp. CECT 9606]CAH0348249.1 Acetate kinase [Aquabacterium sp. CECT 9606]
MGRQPLVLTFNAGSSSIKMGLFSVLDGQATQVGKGVIDLRAQPLRLQVSGTGQSQDIVLNARPTEDLHEVLDETLGWFASHFKLDDLVSVGHRIVHGGDRFDGPVAIDDATLAAMAELVPLAPLHQPQGVRLIQAIRHLRPGLLQAASFDTAFHRSQTDLVRRFAIPRVFFDQGVKRYGFHGLSYQYVAGELARRFPALKRGKVVVAHLGSGASLCALHDGISQDTSMGFSTLDGVPMATRCGALDPGVLLHLMGPGGLSLDEVEDLLYHRSGLLGVSGFSADARQLQASEQPEAREALALFALRIAGEVARLATSLNGLDALVFTAGIGEHQPQVRSAVAEHLAWLGLRLDPQANDQHDAVISAPGSSVTVLVVPTDEEQVIANDTVGIHHRQSTTP